MAVVDSDRRAVLHALLALAATGCAAATVTRTPGGWSRRLSRVEVPPPVVALGQRYLQAHPDEGDATRLRQALGLVDGTEDEPTRRERIDTAVRADLEAGHMVDLEGWALTRTECRVYALAALVG